MSAVNDALQNIIKRGRAPAPRGTAPVGQMSFERLASLPYTPIVNPADRQEPDGGILSTIFKGLAIPGQTVRSGIKETIDLFQGEGFNFGEFRDQALSDEWYGFGDLIHEEGVDLGTWGNRLLGFVGDVATDPFTASGGMAALARAGGTKRLTSNLKFLLDEATDPLRRNAIKDAIKATGQKRSISAARNVLTRNHGKVGKELIDELGIQTGLRFRVPGTGAFLGGITRGSKTMARKRAKQVPLAERARLVKEGALKGVDDTDDLADLIFKSQSKKRLKDLPAGLSEEARQFVRQAARVPVDTLPVGVFPIASGISASIMAGPGMLYEKVATTKGAQAFKKFFVDPQTEYINDLRRARNPQETAAAYQKSRRQARDAARTLSRSRDVDDILLASEMRSGFDRSNMGVGYLTERMQKHTRQVENVIHRNYDNVDDVTLGRIDREPAWVARLKDPEDVVGNAGTPERLVHLQSKYPNMTLQEIGAVKQLLIDLVEEPEMRIFIEDNLYGPLEFGEDGLPVGAFLRDVDDVLNDYGGYSAMVMTEEGKALLRAMYGVEDVADIEWVSGVTGLFEEPLSSVGDMTGAQRRARATVNRLKQRTTQPSRITTSGEYVRGREISIPSVDTPSDRSTWSSVVLKNPGGMRDGTDIRRLNRNFDPNDPASRLIHDHHNMSYPPTGNQELRNANRVRYGFGAEDTLGRSVEEQIDDALIAAGWMEAGQSIWEQGYAAKRAAYVYSMAADARLRFLEQYLASRGIIFNADNYVNQIEALEAAENTVAALKAEYDELSASEKLVRARIAARQNMEATLIEDLELSSEPFTAEGGGRASRDYISGRIRAAADAEDLAEDTYEDLIQELIESDAEVVMITDELSEMIDDINEALTRRGIADPDSPVTFLDIAGYPRRGFGPTSQTRDAIDAVKVLGPILEDIAPAMVRLRVIREAIDNFAVIREEGEQVLDYLGNYSSGPAETTQALIDFANDFLRPKVEFVEDTLIPLLKTRIEDAMLSDRTVRAAELINDTVGNSTSVNMLPAESVRDFVFREFNETLGFPSGTNSTPGYIPANESPVVYGVDHVLASSGKKWKDVILESDHPMKHRMVESLNTLHKANNRAIEAVNDLYTRGIIDDRQRDSWLTELTESGLVHVETFFESYDTQTGGAGWKLMGSHDTLASSFARTMAAYDPQAWETISNGVVQGVLNWLDSTFILAADRMGVDIVTTAAGTPEVGLNVIKNYSVDSTTWGNLAAENAVFVNPPSGRIARVPEEYTYRWRDQDGVYQSNTVKLPGAGTEQQVFDGPADWVSGNVRNYFDTANLDIDPIELTINFDTVNRPFRFDNPTKRTRPTADKPPQVRNWESVTGEEMTPQRRAEIAIAMKMYQGDVARVHGYGLIGFLTTGTDASLNHGNIWADRISKSIRRTPTVGMELNNYQPGNPIRHMQGGIWSRPRNTDLAVPGQLEGPTGAALRRVFGEDPFTTGEVTATFTELEPFLKVVRELGELEDVLQTDYLSEAEVAADVLFDNFEKHFNQLHEQARLVWGDDAAEALRLLSAEGQPDTIQGNLELFNVIRQAGREATEAIEKSRGVVSTGGFRIIDLPQVAQAEFVAGQRIVLGMDQTRLNLVEQIKRTELEFQRAQTVGDFWQTRYGSNEQRLLEEQALVEKIIARGLDLEAQLIAAERERLGFAQDITAQLGSENGKAFNLNSFGGGVDLNNVTAEQLRDVFNYSSRQMWGPWRVAGDEYMANSVIDAMLATQKMNDRQAVGDLVAKYDRVHNWMKAQMVATPGFVMRNIFGGMANMWFADIPLDVNLSTARLLMKGYKRGEGDFEEGLRLLLSETKKGDSNYQQYKDAYQIVRSGGHGGGQAASSVDIDLGQPGFLDYVVGNKENANRQARITLNPLDAGFVLFAGVRHANAFAEQMMRLGTGLHVMNTGGSLDDALEMIYKLHFNYGGLSAIEQKYGKRFFPFYTWTRKNLPLQVELLARNPGKFNRLQTLKENLEYGQEKEGMVPDYFLENFNIQLPWKIGGSVTYGTPDLPLQDLFRLDPTREGGGMALEQIMSGATPFFKTPIEYWANKRLFAGIPYRDEYIKLPVAFRTIPGMTTSLKMLGWGDKNSKGEWMINDKKLGILENMLPFLGRFRRIIPEDEKTQETWIQTIMSTLGGVSVRINTPRRQRSEEIRRSIAESRDREVWKSFENR